MCMLYVTLEADVLNVTPIAPLDSAMWDAVYNHTLEWNDAAVVLCKSAKAVQRRDSQRLHSAISV